MSGGDESNGNWDSCKMFVLNELIRMNKMLVDMGEDINTMSNKITALMVKMAFIGAIAGLVAGALFKLVIK